MFSALNCRFGHYVVLLVVATSLTLPALGQSSLWDIDEGNNAEAAREMLESGNWIIPTFNYQLRVDKPALLYWLQVFAYRAFGVNEFAARLPSALAALLTVLIVYELGRQMFSPSTGLVAGLILSTSVAFCASAHFANPDALLNLTTAATLFVFWQGFSSGSRWWFLTAAVTTALGVLAKGPVGLMLPAGVIFLFLLWSQKLGVLLDRRLMQGFLLFFLVAAPWYIWVGVDTKANFLRGFIFQHNIGRYLQPMEHHTGPAYYYLLVLAVGFVPWSIFLWPTARLAIGVRARDDDGTFIPAYANEGTDTNVCATRGISRYRFLWCWMAVYLLFFTFASTKLPNYILPIYAPVAILTARGLDRWRVRQIELPAWGLNAGLAILAVIGVGVACAVLIASGLVELPTMRGRHLNGLEYLSVLGVPLILGALCAWRCLARQQRGALVAALVGAAAFFVGPLLAWGGWALNPFKAPRELMVESHACQPNSEVRIGCYQYFQPSMVFYSRREVQRFESEEKALEFLASPLKVYLFIPANDWQQISFKAPGNAHLVASHWDLYRGREIVVVTNGEPGTSHGTVALGR
jgi:4-amino-4-deoxy-L-arabinose transferase-like glycosyltransferase